MIGLTVADAAEVLRARVVGRGDGRRRLTDLVVDSRSVTPGALFVALRGERVDGHDYLEDAWRAGAGGCLTDRPVSPDSTGLALVVPDAVAAMGTLARHLVDRSTARGLRVVGITGSQGKTSTKDLLAQVLARRAPTVAPRGNLNNEIGVPLTVSRIEPETAFLVSEMGARGVGHIAYLCRLTPPHVGVVLNIGLAHLGEFGSQAAIAQTKGELVEALPAGGTAVLNADDPLVWGMRSRTEAAVVAFSVRARPRSDAAVWADRVSGGPDGCYGFVLHADTPVPVGGTPVPVQRDAAWPVRLQVAGRHQVGNALAAAAAAVALGMDPADVASGLSEATPASRWRMETTLRGDGLLVVNDAYNANPDSMRAALETVAEVGRSRRAAEPAALTWAVLGDMLELGESEVAAHEALGRHVAGLGYDRLVTLGRFADTIAAAAAAAGMDTAGVHTCGDRRGAAMLVAAQAGPADTVLIKASRGLALETVAEAILQGRPRTEQDWPDHDSEDPA